jgi:hypothetical protein
MKMLPVVLFLLSACHTQAPTVRCDSKLQPINIPAPIVKPAAATGAHSP